MLGAEIRFPLKEKGRAILVLPFALKCVKRVGLVPGDLNAPLSGAGGINNRSWENARAQREYESRFPLQE